MAKKKTDAQTGLLLIDKPGGMTSHDVIKVVRRTFGQREVGHTGTLDPMATGAMVVLLGRATRLARFVESTEKEYVGTVKLGRATTTYDAEGETTAEADVPELTEAQVEAALAALTGPLEQEVPAYSAVKVGGERLYAKARRGEDVELPKRTITIHTLELLTLAGDEIQIRSRVSKGTYIRTFAVQIGEALGLPAHLSALRRTAVGQHDVVNAIKLDDLKGDASELHAMRSAVADLPAVHVDDAGRADVCHGRPLGAAKLVDFGDFKKDDHVAVLCGDELLAVGVAQMDAGAAKTAGQRWAVKYACVLRT